MESRKTEKMIIYQVFPRWFGNTNTKPVRNGSLEENGVGKFSDFTPLALSKIKELGTTHIWYTGVIEHATQTDYTAYHIQKDHRAVVKGKAGSPYAIKDYYDIDPDLADHVENRMEEFEALVARTHDAGMKVIIDFVPNHVARQYHSDAQYNFIEELGQNDNTSKAFDPNNNFYYIPGQPLTLPFTNDDEGLGYSEFPAKATGNDRFDAFPNCNDWYETVKLNYGVDYLNGRSKYFDPIPNTWHKMLDILRFWASKQIDGFRCDMAEMVPVEFWEWAIPLVKKDYPVIFIAEVYNPAEYRNYIFNGHFDYLYDKVGLYDTLRAVICGQAPASNIPACWQSLEGIQSHMLNFLENHDEQRLASDFFAKDPSAGISGLMVSALMNTNPMMIYSGQELGERGMDEEGFSGLDGRTTIFDYWSVSTLRNWKNGGKYDGGKLTEKQKQLRQQYAAILNIAKNEPAITQGSFFDLMYTNEKNRFFNNRNQYAFLRKHKNEVILVVANFTHSEQNVWVNIPEDAFKALDIKDNEAAMLKDLLTGTETISTLTTAWPFKVKLEACSGKVLKFTY
ncbi:alpha-amylase family glycosyl hydrolase [Parabacteroides sp. AGMB00274]|uniref:Alpha-amylase family glycosyl hydrolase n=1 Tax=Parabacteroides faecalis TaxID=2924040 RepID=A0ABT0C1K8_9BACT|nr:alpha-amylase family glycosyl hydrolase [Parabacteroides faecalis]MCI7287052.1 alpha-amylase family glycosyl hydrolase [Parabacteroides sp.]MCJ2380909.1 alpha-amylase family glycosyl hydrolase [Parabacteroides faecalis]MDY6253622.1 alpha-amylase family glycosyl hydrolase [Bacteroidales bacterium]